MEASPSAGFYTRSLHDTLGVSKKEKRIAFRTLYMDSAKSIFTYATDRPKGNNEPLTAEKVVQLIQTDSTSKNYTTDLKIKALHTLILFMKDREELYRHDYQGLVGKIKQIVSIVLNYIQGYGRIDDAEKERNVIRVQLTKLDNEIKEEEKESTAKKAADVQRAAEQKKREAEAAAAEKIKLETEAAERLTQNRITQLLAEAKLANESETQAAKKVEAEAAKRLAEATDREQQEKKRIATEQLQKQQQAQKPQPTSPKPTSNAKAVNTPEAVLASKGDHYFTLTSLLRAEGTTVDPDPNGPCTQALYAVFLAAFNGAQLDNLEVKCENPSAPRVYVMTLDMARKGDLDKVPGQFRVSKTVSFSLEDKDETKVLRFLEKSVYVRVGYQNDKKETGWLAKMKSAVASLAYKDFEAEFYFKNDGTIKILCSLAEVHQEASYLADLLGKVKWSADEQKD